MSADGPTVTGRRWTKGGQDRLFLAVDGREVGWLDMAGGALHPADGVPPAVLAAAAQHWSRAQRRRLPRLRYRNQPWPPPDAALPKARDLTRHRPGKAVAAQARAERGGVTKRALEWTGDAQLAALGITRSDQVWDAGARGERIVGKILDGLGGGWRVLHAVPVGRNGADIDHVLIGPGGVYTINAKHHPRRRLLANEVGIWLDREPVDYYARSQVEAERAARLLSRAAGMVVPVSPVIVLAAGELITAGNPPVAVLHARDLAGWVLDRPVAWTVSERVWAVAVDRRTWQPFLSSEQE